MAVDGWTELLHVVQPGGDWARSLVAVPNVTAHPSTASDNHRISVYLLCGFNAPIKRLTNTIDIATNTVACKLS